MVDICLNMHLHLDASSTSKINRVNSRNDLSHDDDDSTINIVVVIIIIDG